MGMFHEGSGMTVVERLTHKRANGIKEGYWSPNKKQELVDTLAAYEDTGLTAEQIRVLKERDMAKRCRQSIFDHDSIKCVCGSDIGKDAEFMFCPWCGQRLKKREK